MVNGKYGGVRYAVRKEELCSYRSNWMTLMQINVPEGTWKPKMTLGGAREVLAAVAENIRRLGFLERRKTICMAQTEDEVLITNRKGTPFLRFYVTRI